MRVPKRQPPIPHRESTLPQAPHGILELDRFSEASLERWNSVSRDLDELEAVLFFGLEPERRRLRPEIIAAIRHAPDAVLELQRWVRLVTYQYSLEPLSCAGSLLNVGGRFNAGIELDPNTMDPWPALYLAQDHETAFREKFQLAQDGKVDGLTAQELALEHGVSHASLFVAGRLSRVFDMTSHRSLDALAQVLRKIDMPMHAKKLGKRLGIPAGQIAMARTARQIHDAVLKDNWRMQPVQFGLPAKGHVLAELVRAAGFEGILYKSTKGPGNCLAVFPDLLAAGSFIELVDSTPPGVAHSRLDGETAPVLAGWQSLPPRFRSR